MGGIEEGTWGEEFSFLVKYPFFLGSLFLSLLFSSIKKNELSYLRARHACLWLSLLEKLILVNSRIWHAKPVLALVATRLP